MKFRGVVLGGIDKSKLEPFGKKIINVSLEEISSSDFVKILLSKKIEIVLPDENEQPSYHHDQ